MLVTYIKASDEIQFEVDVLDNTYVSIGFGRDMYNVDMIAWHGLGANSYAADYWSTRNDTPKVDNRSDLSTTFTQNSGRIKFVTRRKLDTGDTLEDYLIPLNQEIDIVWALHHQTGEWKEHSFKGYYSTTFDETLGNLPVAADVVQPAVALEEADGDAFLSGDDDARGA